eukprot:14023532-Alexandrium_andersonii.AAC.1
MSNQTLPGVQQESDSTPLVGWVICQRRDANAPAKVKPQWQNNKGMKSTQPRKNLHNQIRFARATTTTS